MSLEAALRLTRAHAYRDAGHVNHELDRLLAKTRDARFADLERRLTKKDAAKSATPQS